MVFDGEAYPYLWNRERRPMAMTSAASERRAPLTSDADNAAYSLQAGGSGQGHSDTARAKLGCKGLGGGRGA